MDEYNKQVNVAHKILLWRAFAVTLYCQSGCSDIQSDSKRWTQLNSKRRLNTRQIVGCGIPSSLLALRVDLRGLRSKFS